MKARVTCSRCLAPCDPKSFALEGILHSPLAATYVGESLVCCCLLFRLLKNYVMCHSHSSLRWDHSLKMCRSQVPDASVSVPGVSGSLPEVSGDVSVPSVGGGVDVDVAVPSVDVDASAPSASIDLPGEYVNCCKHACLVLAFVRYFAC